MYEGPQGPATQLLAEIRYELSALTDAVRELQLAAQPEMLPAPYVEVLPAPVVVEDRPAVLDFGPLLEALGSLRGPDQTPLLIAVLEQIAGMRQDLKDQVEHSRRQGQAQSMFGIGASSVTVTNSVPVQNVQGDRLNVAVQNFPAVQQVTDFYTTTEVLPDQAGANGVLTFTFTSTPKMVWVKSTGGISRAVTSGVPTASFGIPCDDGVPQPLSVQTQNVSVYAPTGATVTVWGFS